MSPSAKPMSSRMTAGPPASSSFAKAYTWSAPSSGAPVGGARTSASPAMQRPSASRSAPAPWRRGACDARCGSPRAPRRAVRRARLGGARREARAGCGTCQADVARSVRSQTRLRAKSLVRATSRRRGGRPRERAARAWHRPDLGPPRREPALLHIEQVQPVPQEGRMRGRQVRSVLLERRAHARRRRRARLLGLRALAPRIAPCPGAAVRRPDAPAGGARLRRPRGPTPTRSPASPMGRGALGRRVG